MWAFSNCRVDAPGRPVAEVDWLFYNVRNGTLMVSEWKGFPQRVALATDTGTPWLLDGGLALPNPIEQVSRQLDAVRAALRGSILPQHFPAFDPLQLRIMQSVYSPQVDQNTTIERIRWGKVYGDLPELAAVIANSASRSPLFLPDAGARLALATALCALFRTTFPPEAETKLRVPPKGGDTDVVRRISAIHRQIAALHAELADLVVTAAGADTRTARPPAAGTAPQAAVKDPPVKVVTAKAAPAAPAKAPSLSEHQRMNAHLTRRFQGVNGSAAAATKALETAWRSALGDTQLHEESGISVSLFGAVGTPLVKQHHGSLPKVLGMPLRKWCVLQAKPPDCTRRTFPASPRTCGCAERRRDRRPGRQRPERRSPTAP